MKLWIKISLIAIIMVTFSSGICSLMMLIRNGQSNLDFVVQNTLTDQKLRMTAWQSAMEKDGGGVNASTQRTLARYHIAQYADNNTVLVSDADVILNPTGIDPKEVLPLEDLEWNNQQYVIKELSGQTILIAGSNADINAASYSMYVIRDIGGVFTGIETLARQFTLINLLVLAASTVIIVVLVRLVLKPVTTLKNNTGLIADGIYDKRATIKEHDEIGELAGDFNRMAAAVENHVRELRDEAERRSMFIAALTHEMKTPVTSISGSAQTLLRTKLTDEEREDALLQIDDECTRMERLSQKMMQLIVLRQGGDIELTPQSMDALFAIVQKSCAEKLKRSGLTLHIENGISTLAMDADLMSSLLLNLIDNAGKASKPGDIIEIHAAGDTIAVIDRGKGIPPEELRHITQPFYRVDKSRSRKEGNIGLGLALCQEIAALHGARLEFESEPGKGTTVRVVFEHV